MMIGKTKNNAALIMIERHTGSLAEVVEYNTYVRGVAKNITYNESNIVGGGPNDNTWHRESELDEEGVYNKKKNGGR